MRGMCNRNGVRSGSVQSSLGAVPDPQAMLGVKSLPQAMGTKRSADFWSTASSLIALQNGSPRLTARTNGEPAALSLAQERLWGLEQPDPGAAYYNIPLTRLI